MRFKRHAELKKGQLDIAPLIDVVFLLLIFFMLTSSFILQPGIKVKLPKAVTSETLPEEGIIVTVASDGVLYLSSSPITLRELGVMLKQAALENKPVLIKADRASAVGRVVEVWDLCRSNGISQVNIATMPKGK